MIWGKCGAKMIKIAKLRNAWEYYLINSWEKSVFLTFLIQELKIIIHILSIEKELSKGYNDHNYSQISNNFD